MKKIDHAAERVPQTHREGNGTRRFENRPVDLWSETFPERALALQFSDSRALQLSNSISERPPKIGKIIGWIDK